MSVLPAAHTAKLKGKRPHPLLVLLARRMEGRGGGGQALHTIWLDYILRLEAIRSYMACAGRCRRMMQ